MSIIDYLYSESFIPDVIDKYVKELSTSDNLLDIQHANKLIRLKNMIFDQDYLDKTLNFFDKCFFLIKNKYSIIQDNHQTIGCSIDGRRKGLLRAEEKINLYLDRGLSLNLVRDFFAFRIVLFGNVENLQEYCYKVTEDVIDLAIRNSYTICEALPLVNSSLIENNQIYSSFKYSQYTKDYIRYPKQDTGYQSLHFVLVDIYGRHLEVQVRTDSMHLMAEHSLRQNHKRHEDKRYGIGDERLVNMINREKISIVGYKCLSKRTQVIDYLSEEITTTELEKVNKLLSDNIITEDTLYLISHILKDYDTDKVNTWITEIRKFDDKVSDFAGVESGVSIFHRQSF